MFFLILLFRFSTRLFKIDYRNMRYCSKCSSHPAQEAAEDEVRGRHRSRSPRSQPRAFARRRRTSRVRSPARQGRREQDMSSM